MTDRDIARNKRALEDFERGVQEYERRQRAEAVVFVICAVLVLALFTWMQVYSFDRQIDLIRLQLETP